MSESLPGPILEDTPEIVWSGVDSDDQLKVICNGVALAERPNWVGVARLAQGLRTKIFLSSATGAFEIAVVVDSERSVGISLRDGRREYVHTVTATPGVEQGIVRFSQDPAGNWQASASYMARTVGAQPLVVAGGDGQDFTRIEQRLASLPADCRVDVESLLRSAPVLLDGIDGVDLVVDMSASMHHVVMSDALEQFAELGWRLGQAASDAPKTAVLVGQGLTRSAVPRSASSGEWVAGVRDKAAHGMPTGDPDEIFQALKATAERTFTICLTDAPPTRIAELAGRVQGPVAVIVGQDQVEAAKRVDPGRWSTPPDRRFALVAWNRNHRMISAVLAAAPPLGAADSERGNP